MIDWKPGEEPMILGLSSPQGLSEYDAQLVSSVALILDPGAFKFPSAMSGDGGTGAHGPAHRQSWARQRAWALIQVIRSELKR